MNWKDVPEIRVSDVFNERILKNRNWYEKSWGGVLHPLFIVGYGVVPLLNQRVKDSFPIGICFVHNDKMRWLWDTRDIERIRVRILNLLSDNPSSVYGWVDAWKQDWKEFIAVCSALEKTSLQELTDAELSAAYEQLVDAYIQESSLPYLTDSFLASGKTDWLVDMITEEIQDKVSKENIASTLACLTAPVHTSFSQDERISLLSLAEKLIRKKDTREVLNTCNSEAVLRSVKKYPSLLKLLSDHVSHFYWVENSYYEAPFLDESYFLKTICELSKTSDILSSYRKEAGLCLENKKRKQALYKKLKISERLRSIITLSEDFSKWQDTRKSCVFRVNHFIFRILDEMASRLKLPPAELYYTIPSELQSVFLDRKYDRKKLQLRRSEGCAFAFTAKGWRLFEGKEYRGIDQDIFFGNPGQRKVLKGVPASPGSAKGTVRVVFKPHELRNVKKGEIIVTNNTTPDFVPAMRRAAAVITEQGGITSHAAVVSRELKVPCIIGIKQVTHILKDGDLVEVDANHGVVKILKKYTIT